MKVLIAGKAQAAAKHRNALAMANFTMAFETDGLLGMIYKAMSKDWPGGLAYMVVAQLMIKFNLEDRISRVELRSMLNGVKMKVHEDPSVLFEQVSSIRN